MQLVTAHSILNFLGESGTTCSFAELLVIQGSKFDCMKVIEFFFFAEGDREVTVHLPALAFVMYRLSDVHMYRHHDARYAVFNTPEHRIPREDFFHLWLRSLSQYPVVSETSHCTPDFDRNPPPVTWVWMTGTHFIGS